MNINSASVLVVDDVAENRDLLVRRLRRLGIAEGAAYSSGVVDFNSGDALLVVTDGLTDAAEPGGELLGDPRVERYFAARDPNTTGALDALINDVRSFEAGQPASDDMAAVLLSVA